MQIDDLRLLGIPRSRFIISIIYPYHDAGLKDCPGLSAKEKQLVECISVARVRPRTSKGNLERGIPSKRKSSICIDYVPALCTHRPSHLPIEWSGEASGLWPVHFIGSWLRELV